MKRPNNERKLNNIITDIISKEINRCLNAILISFKKLTKKSKKFTKKKSTKRFGKIAQIIIRNVDNRHLYEIRFLKIKEE